jgi:hypothetical protein
MRSHSGRLRRARTSRDPVSLGSPPHHWPSKRSLYQVEYSLTSLCRPTREAAENMAQIPQISTNIANDNAIALFPPGRNCKKRSVLGSA